MKGPSALLEKKALHDAMPVVSVDPKTTQALARSLSSGTFIDMQFNTFTRMRKVGNQQRLCRPLPLYAASSALKGVEACGVDIAGTNWSSLLSTSDHGRSFVDAGNEYEEDSDFDPDEHIIEEVVEKVHGTLVSNTSDTMSVGSSEFSDLTSDGLAMATYPSVSRTVLVTGAAYKTWKAFLFYAYTGQTNLSSLTSCNVSEELQALPADRTEDSRSECPRCSPKSMYRLAHKLQLESLKQIAFQEIRRNLKNENILTEVLSKFTSRYPEIRDMETDFLLAHRHEKGVMDTLPGKMERVMRGEMPHCKEVLTAIMLASIKRD
ncbi:hypothetical protein CONPUDRAFT_151827 [Coniophora puteana RWD-64-598 SS2]|uniref:BTB domain-containing protein n=1 Tax=Coniophora puteana (strain RWD-64-598) TaxID=741705 RepID=A0A5M3MUU5_CONPW|nr:uncharacterized protein CONPUDRAFT_151827 [Coniophora puteana RWD-64-598 SS2]EIW82767.1 hypothetical protein CONPUDRAFT_151827 [Coniophora puteana RWD-64-598 SS2]